MSWSGVNPTIFPAPLGGLAYSRFAPGEMGDNENSAQETGTTSVPEVPFPVAPGNPVPGAWSLTIGNQLGPGGTPNK
jgi:hypothetical protein